MGQLYLEIIFQFLVYTDNMIQTPMEWCLVYITGSH